MDIPRAIGPRDRGGQRGTEADKFERETERDRGQRETEAGIVMQDIGCVGLPRAAHGRAAQGCVEGRTQGDRGCIGLQGHRGPEADRGQRRTEAA